MTINLNSPGIYAIVNKESGKVYVGSTIRNLRKRWLKHKHRLNRNYHENPHLQHAWDKYGENVFDFIVLEYVDMPEIIIGREQYWLDEMRLITDVYNMGTLAANPMFGRKHTEETKRKLSESRKGTSLSEETKRKIGNFFRGTTRTKEVRQKISEGHKGKKFTDEHKQNLSRSKGKPYPAFTHIEIGEIIPVGVNLRFLCRSLNLHQAAMWRVIHGKQKQHKGWSLK